MSVNVADYLLTPVVPFTTLETISLPVTGPAGTVPVSLGIGNTTAFLPLSSIFGSAPAEAVIIDPATSARNTIQSTNTNATPLRLKAVAGQTVRLMEWVDPNEVLLGGIGPGGSCIFKGFAAGVNAKTANYTATGTDHTIPVNATAGPVAISLPPAAVASPFGLELLIIKTDASANAVTVQAAGGDTINGAATLVLAVQWDSANLTADGVTKWFEEVSPTPDLSGAVILAPSSVNRNQVIPTADANKGISIKPHSLTQTAPLLETLNADNTANLVVRSRSNPSNTILEIDVWDVNNDTALTILHTAAGAAAPIQITAGSNFWDMTSAMKQEVFLADSLGAFAHALDINPTLTDNTAGAYKSRTDLIVYDAGGARTGLRMEADGAAARIGFLGAAAVVQQANASQAAISAVVDSNAKSSLQAIYNLLNKYGLAPATA